MFLYFCKFLYCQRRRFPDQVESELGFSYEDADRVLFRMVDQRLREDEIVAQGFERELVATIARRIIRNQFKRLPPVIAKLQRRSIQHDFRYLRDWHR